MNKQRIDLLVKLGLLAAISLVLVFTLKFSIFPAVAFLEYDFADVPILIATFMFGPLSGLALTAVVSVLQWLLASQAGGWIGAIMHFLSTGAMVLVAGNIYKRMHNLKGAILSLLLGASTMVAVMIPLNLLVTPLYLANMPYSDAQTIVWGLMPFIIAFNAIKAFGNAIITFILYKQVSKVLKIEFINRVNRVQYPEPSPNASKSKSRNMLR
ncbi:MAG: ECF transporter S component [Christensenellaceae bacterium]|nr:ECF transporter S component [Christensenellaceae bacterium]